MNEKLLHKDVQKFIFQHLNDDIPRLVLKGSSFNGISIHELVEQIISKRKCKKKLPSWFARKDIYYPPPITVEQASSEITAHYKASLLPGGQLADLTGGLGIDTYFFAKNHVKVHYFELQATLSGITRYNLGVLGVKNVSCLAADGISAVKSAYYNTIYADPSRRHKTKGKVFLLSDCEPDIVQHQGYLLEHCDNLLVKTSPMLDISAGLKQLKSVSEIHVVAVNNEVKELLWLLRKNSVQPIKIKAVNLKKETSDFIIFDYGQPAEVHYAFPKKYLYEPNAAVMKSGAYSIVCTIFGVEKLHQHTHLYTSEELINFPGRRFEIIRFFTFHKKQIRTQIQTRASAVSRNFPISTETLKKQWKFTETEELYYFFTTLKDGKKYVLECTKIAKE